MKKTILEQYKIKEIDPDRLIEAMFAVVGSYKIHEIFTEYVALEVWEEVKEERKERCEKEWLEKKKQ